MRSNGTSLSKFQSFNLLLGANSSGKSTYLAQGDKPPSVVPCPAERCHAHVDVKWALPTEPHSSDAVGLMCILAQAGLWVPAQEMLICPFRSIVSHVTAQKESYGSTSSMLLEAEVRTILC